MQLEEVKEIIAALPRGRTIYHYFPDRYALWLLARAAGEGMPVAELKRGPYGRLLNRPAAKAVIAGRADGVVSAGHFQAAWPRRWQSYRLTLGRWGSDPRRAAAYYQTSRPGWNLVLQMNFSEEHNAAYRRYIRNHARRPFEAGAHPVARPARGKTLAWARLDLDLATGEALIEELQNDWLRYAEWWRDRALRMRTAGEAEANESGDDPVIYYDKVLAPHRRHWDKALLLAVLIFLAEEIGIRRVWLHEAECGPRLKQIRGTPPPRSLYSALPRSFCFSLTGEPPSFLTAAAPTPLRRMAREGGLRFWHTTL